MSIAPPRIMPNSAMAMVAEEPAEPSPALGSAVAPPTPAATVGVVWAALTCATDEVG